MILLLLLLLVVVVVHLLLLLVDLLLLLLLLLVIVHLLRPCDPKSNAHAQVCACALDAIFFGDGRTDKISSTNPKNFVDKSKKFRRQIKKCLSTNSCPPPPPPPHHHHCRPPHPLPP